MLSSENQGIKMNLKPFDLERALAGDKLIYRNGDKVIDFKYFNNLSYQPRLATITEDGELTWHDADGNFHGKKTIKHNYDLFMALKTKKLWIAIAKNARHDGGHNASYHAVEDKEYLDKYFPDEHHIEIEIEE